MTSFSIDAFRSRSPAHSCRRTHRCGMSFVFAVSRLLTIDPPATTNLLSFSFSKFIRIQILNRFHCCRCLQPFSSSPLGVSTFRTIYSAQTNLRSSQAPRCHRSSAGVCGSAPARERSQRRALNLSLGGLSPPSSTSQLLFPLRFL